MLQNLISMLWSLQVPSSFDLKNITLNTVIRTGYPYPFGGRDLINNWRWIKS